MTYCPTRTCQSASAAFEPFGSAKDATSSPHRSYGYCIDLTPDPADPAEPVHLDRFVAILRTDAIDGIFSGMKSVYESVAVLDDLGDKVVDGIAIAVRDTRRDLAEYREMRPAWVAEHSERGLANWIHDRLWAHLQRQLEHLPGCRFDNDEPERHFRVGTKYHFRAKRHDEYGSIATYPTQGALDFMEQQLTLDGMEEVRLIGGYLWDRETRAVLDAVISLRDSIDNVIWLEKLSTPATGSAATPISPTGSEGPQLPLSLIHI